MPNEVLLKLAYNIKYKDSYGGINDGKWQFYVYHEPVTTGNYNGVKVDLDILVNNRPTTAECEVVESYYLKCISDHNNPDKSDVIKIYGKTEPTSGTVYFQTELTNEQKTINPVSFGLNYESKESSYSSNKLTFILNGKLEEDINYKIFENSYTEVSIFSYESTSDGTKTDVPCLTGEIDKAKGSTVKITCEVEVNNKLNVKIYKDENNISGLIKIITEEDIELKAAQSEEDSTTNEEKTDTSTNKPNSVNYLVLDKLFMLLLLVLI